MKDSGFWRIIFGFPLVLYIICLMGSVFYVRYESIKFCVFNDRRDEAKNMIRNVYHKTESADEIIISFEVNA